MPPHLRVRLVDKQAASEYSFTIQRSGVLYLKPGGAGSTDDSDRLDLNTGNTSAEEMSYHYPVVD